MIDLTNLTNSKEEEELNMQWGPLDKRHADRPPPLGRVSSSPAGKACAVKACAQSVKLIKNFNFPAYKFQLTIL